jgi:uncharacterized protein YeaO (DUF488 family)
LPVRIVRLGTPRHPDEGPRLGTVRRPPRGVAKSQYAAQNYYDTWLPDLAPSAALVAAALRAGDDDAAWRRFERRYRAEMKQPAASRLLDVLALLSRGTNFSVGCYCEDERRCHRSILRELLSEHGAHVIGHKDG